MQSATRTRHGHRHTQHTQHNVICSPGCEHNTQNQLPNSIVFTMRLSVYVPPNEKDVRIRVCLWMCAVASLKPRKTLRAAAYANTNHVCRMNTFGAKQIDRTKTKRDERAKKKSHRSHANGQPIYLCYRTVLGAPTGQERKKEKNNLVGSCRCSTSARRTTSRGMGPACDEWSSHLFAAAAWHIDGHRSGREPFANKHSRMIAYL